MKYLHRISFLVLTDDCRWPGAEAVMGGTDDMTGGMGRRASLRSIVASAGTGMVG